MTVHDDVQAILPQSGLNTPSKKDNASSSHAQWILWSILGLILIAVFYLGFTLQSQLQTHQQMAQQINLLHRNIDTLKKQQTALETQTNTSIQTLSNTQEQLKNKTTALEADPGPNLMASINQLDAAQHILDALPLKSASHPSILSEKTSNQGASTWQDRLRDNVSLLEKLVVIRHQEEDIVPLPTPAYEALLRETIRLNLQEAQWALLQTNPTIYHLALTQAIQNITRAFDIHAERTKTLLKSLQALQQIPFPSTKPRLEEPLRLLNQLMSVDNTSSTSSITPIPRP